MAVKFLSRFANHSAFHGTSCSSSAPVKRIFVSNAKNAGGVFGKQTGLKVSSCNNTVVLQFRFSSNRYQKSRNNTVGISPPSPTNDQTQINARTREEYEDDQTKQRMASNSNQAFTVEEINDMVKIVYKFKEHTPLSVNLKKYKRQSPYPDKSMEEINVDRTMRSMPDSSREPDEEIKTDRDIPWPSFSDLEKHKLQKEVKSLEMYERAQNVLGYYCTKKQIGSRLSNATVDYNVQPYNSTS